MAFSGIVSSINVFPAHVASYSSRRSEASHLSKGAKKKSSLSLKKFSLRNQTHLVLKFFMIVEDVKTETNYAVIICAALCGILKTSNFRNNTNGNGFE